MFKTLYWVESVVGFSALLQEVFLQVPRFSPSSKSSISKLQIRPGMVAKEPLCGCATSDSLFIMFLNDT